VTEKFYIKGAPEFAAKQLLRMIEGGRSKQKEEQQKKLESGTKTGTTGD
jgi:hypothetical protein